MIKRFEIIFLNLIILILISGVATQVDGKEKKSSNAPLTFSSKP